MFSNAVIFADDASILSALHNVDASEREGEREKERERDRERQRKRQRETKRDSLSFNPVPSKHAQKIILCCISKKLMHPSLIFNISESVKPIHSNLMQ